MIQTTRGFKKPENTDNADLKVFVGDNMDKIEEVLNDELHSHNNKAVLDKFTESEDKLYFDGTKVSGHVHLTVNTARAAAVKVTEETVTFQEGITYLVTFTDGISVSTPTLNGKNIRVGSSNVTTVHLTTTAGVAIIIPMYYNASTDTMQLFGSTVNTT